MSSKYFKLASVFVVGLALGYASLNVHVTDFKKNTVAAGLNDKETSNQETTGIPTKETLNSESNKKIKPLLKIPKLSQESKLDDIVEYFTIRERQSHYSIIGDRSLRQLLTDKPSLILDIFNGLPDIENEAVKQRLSMTLFISSRRNKLALENALLEKLKTGDDFMQWVEISNSASISNEEVVDLFNNHLVTLVEADDIAQVISAIARPNGGQPRLLSPDKKEAITANLGQYLNSPSAQVRAAAIGSFDIYPPKDIENTLLAALADSSPKVRSAATMSALQLLPSSSKIINQLMFSIEDPTVNAHTRQHTALLLSSLPLSSNDALTVAKATQEIESFFKAMTQQQLDDYFETQLELNEKD